MKTLLLCIGKTKTDYLQKGVEEYSLRISRMTDFGVQILAAPKNAASVPAAQLKLREAELMLGQIAPSDFVVLLDERGQHLSSKALADLIRLRQNTSVKRLVFVIGGAFGSAASMFERSNLTLALSSMTLTHDMARLLLCEQIYRAYSIVGGERYHHE